jgi:hypothetical protein
MAQKKGGDGRLYRNTGSYASPTWVEVARIRDNSLYLTKGETDVSTRASVGWRERLATLKDASATFTLLPAPSGTDNDFVAIKDSFINDTAIEFLILDGPLATVGSQGLRATCQVFSCTRSEALEEAIAYEVNLMPTPAENAPSWYVAT